MRKRRDPYGISSRRRRRRFSPLAIVGVVVSLLVVLAAGAVVLWQRMDTHAAADAQPNMDCTLIVPAHPLTARGLATPYQLVATDPAQGPCDEANPAQAAFVQGSVLDADTGQVFIYNPLVINKGTKPAIPPVVPKLPDNEIVALWFGFNGGNLTLQSSDNSLRDGKCVNGIKNSIFGQFAYCNAPVFFQKVNQAVNNGQLKVPSLGMARDGKPCPSVRDFGVVDQDQSDNVTGAYLVLDNGRTAQATAANKIHLPKAVSMNNGSDNGLVDAFIDPALGCTPWTAPDLADPGHNATALPLNEVQALVYQRGPVALVPENDPMVLDSNNNFSLAKTNAYRAGVDQLPAQMNNQADPKAYCQNLVKVGAPRIVLDAPFTVNMTTPDDATGNSLFTFLAQRFVNSYQNLNCQQLLNKPSPLVTTQDANGVATGATFNGQPVNTGTGPTTTPATPMPAPTATHVSPTTTPATPAAMPTPTTTGTGTGAGAPDCSINGQVVKGCNGAVLINGQQCQVSFTNNVVMVDCPKNN